ncbi:hypothetical protein GDO81_013622 [Engystomops pustulosus]|nr:hypothetical protein GDO81_013622 [Engystomops pustulosus]
MWDEEERIFIPNLCENFEIKVVELRGLTTILVGVVTCDSSDFFTTRPRIIIVDITELGTIKLQLEVTWNPFDNSKILSTPGMANKFSSSVRKMSLYHWTPPNTPSFRDKFYLSDIDSTYPSLEKDIQTPYILSYLANSGFPSHCRSLEHSMEVNSIDSFRNLEETGDESNPRPPSSCGETLPYSSQELTKEECPPSHDSLDILRETPKSTQNIMKRSRLEFDIGTSTELKAESQTLISDLMENTTEKINTVAESQRHFLPNQLANVLDLLQLEDAKRWKMKEMEQSVLHFKERVLRSSHCSLELPSMDSLMVETALESFDFLNTDFSADDMSLLGSVRTHSKSNWTLPPSVAQTFSSHNESEQEGLGTGHEDLDTLLSIHLEICKVLLKKLISPNTARIIQHHLLEELSLQREVLEDLSIIFIQKAQENPSVEDIFPKTKKIRHFLKLWESCIKPECPWFCSSEVLLNQLKKMFVLKIKAKYPGQLEAVFRRVLEQIFGFGGVMVPNDIPESIVSIFLLYGYLRKYHVNDLEKHFSALTREVTLIGDLQLPGRLKKIKKLKAKQISRLQPLPQFLKLVATFQIDENMKLCKAATGFLRRASVNKHFKQKAVLYYTELLSDKDVQLQRSACLALKHLKGTASIDQIAGLCQSEVEDVRILARETILSFGHKGRNTFGKTDKICRELQETLTLDGEIEITVF